MATLRDFNLRIGNTAASVSAMPSVLTGSTPYLTWELPVEIEQKRFNLRYKSQESIAEFVIGEQISSDQFYQWPFAIPMSDLWLGLVHIELVISTNENPGDTFQYTSGPAHNYFVHDTIAENIFDSTDVLYRWKNAIDVNLGQTISYEILVASDPLFEPIDIIDQDVVSESGQEYTIDPGLVEVDKIYFWKVRAYDQLDYGPWTVVHAFDTSEAVPPIVIIDNVYVLGNQYGDVVIEFTTSDTDSDYINVLFNYTGGSVGFTPTPVSTTSNLNKVPDGSHSVIWRSGRDEQLIAASDYVLYAKGYDGAIMGVEDSYGAFAMDNSTIGIEPGGFGAIEIEFPLKSAFVKQTQSSVGGHLYPLESAIFKNKPSHSVSNRMITNPLITHTIYLKGDVEEPSWDEPSRSWQWPDDTLESSSANFDVFEDDQSAPKFTLDPDTYDTNGYPYELVPEKVWSYQKGRAGYIKLYRPEYGYDQADDDYGYRLWKPEFIGGVNVRTPKPDQYRGERMGTDQWGDPEVNGMSIIGVPYYVPVTQVLNPIDVDFHSVGRFLGELYKGRYQLIVGLHTEDDTWEIPAWQQHEILGTVVDPESPKLKAAFVKKVESTTRAHYFPLQSAALLGTFYGSFGGVGGDIDPDLDYIITGAFSDLWLRYFSGIPPDTTLAHDKRPVPPYPGDRGYKLLCELGKKENLEPLQIIYLQQAWDAYNTVHWLATLGYSTNIHLQYTQYTSPTAHGPWKDTLSRNSVFNEEFGLYLVPPLHWHTYFDTISSALFESGYDYRFRVRMFDSVSKTFSEFVYSNKFVLNHEAINPVNVLSTYYEPWHQELIITFRVDDTQGDLYEIIGVQYSTEGAVFHDIEIRDITGDRELLQANVAGDSVSELDIITYQIKWKTGDYNLTAGDNYRIRIFATLASLTEGVDFPVFKWWLFNNPSITAAEREITSLLGKSQDFVWNDETAEWEESDPPTRIPGVVSKNEALIEQIRSEPAPLGYTEFFQNNDPDQPLIDPEGYNDWLNTDIGGSTRDETIQALQEQNEIIYTQTLPELYEKRDRGEIVIRRELIKQGYYNNGYVNNNTGQGLFRFRVESKQFDEAEDENTTYSSRYEVYWRIQVDFYSTFDSQEGNKPLRDMMFNLDGSRLQTGPTRHEAQPNTDREWTYQPETSTAAEDRADPDAEGEVWSGGNSVLDPNDTEIGSTTAGKEPIYGDYTDTFDSRGFGTHPMPKSELPGERSGYYLNASYPSMTDTLPYGLDTFNHDYYWQIAAYNLISKSRNEIPQVLITDVQVYPTEDMIAVTYLAAADESVESITHEGQWWGYSGWEYSESAKTPEWEEEETVLFPTDVPRDGNGDVIQDDRKIVTWVSVSRYRTRPWVIITEDHQYYMWCTKPSAFAENVITMNMGKSPEKFGEYSQLFPYVPTHRVSTIGAASHYYAPTVVQRDRYYWSWCTALTAGANSIVYSKTRDDFDEWDNPLPCPGLEDCYYPSVMYEGGQYKMWCGKFDSGLSKIFYFTSSDGISWNAENGGAAVYTGSDDVNAPCVIGSSGSYTMYYTETVGGSTRISSLTSADGIAWSGNQVEVGNASNPCVVVDRYLGNEHLRMYYNEVVGGVMSVRTAILNDRNWSGGSYGSGDLAGIVTSIQGAEKSIQFSMSQNGLSHLGSGADLRIRLNFVLDYTSKLFKIQSEWTDENSPDKEYLYPESKFRYHEVMKSLNYLGM